MRRSAAGFAADCGFGFSRVLAGAAATLRWLLVFDPASSNLPLYRILVLGLVLTYIALTLRYAYKSRDLGTESRVKLSSR